MSASTRGTLMKDRCRSYLALIATLALGFSLAACNAESVGGPSTLGDPIGDLGDVGEQGNGGGDEEIGAPGRPCLFVKSGPGCRY